MWSSIGHTQIKQLLDKQLGRGQFPHAYLFVGPTGVGKKLLAQEMAGQILRAERLDNHPDYIYFDAGSDVGMEQLREFLMRLASKPFIGQHKIAILDNMEQANMQMSNALLKTLEEPSPSTVLFVLANQNSLLPTIVSRCQTLSFNPLSQQEMAEYAGAAGLELDESLLIASAGSPGRLSKLLHNTDEAEQLQRALAQLEQVNHAGTAERLLAVNSLAELEVEQLKDVLLSWLYRLRATLAQMPHNGRLISGICEALNHLNGSFNKKMVLERLLLQTYEA